MRNVQVVPKQKQIIEVILLLLFIFCCLFLLIYPDKITKIDSPILAWVQETFSFIPKQIPIFISDFGYEMYMLPQLFIAAIFLIKIKRIREFILLFLFAELSYLIVLIIKNIVHRPRPDIIYQKILETGYSFPSGHSCVNMFFYATVIFILNKIIKNENIKILTNILCITIILAVGFSRIYLGVHYFTDIVGGYILGFLLAYLYRLSWKD